MGKTGTTQWVQVKGVKGQVRLVPKSEGEVKRPGPNQRFKSSARATLNEQAAADQRGGPRGGRGGGRSGGGRGGRGGSRNRSESSPTANPLVRKAIRRPKTSIMGAKQKGR